MSEGASGRRLCHERVTREAHGRSLVCPTRCDADRPAVAPASIYALASCSSSVHDGAVAPSVAVVS
jgi:hypothetical protein